MGKALAFIDLLGFSQMVNLNEEKARTILNDFYNIAFGEIKDVPSVKGHLFSDSLLAYSESREDLVNCLARIYRRCLKKNGSYNELSKFFLLPRGAISTGIVNVEERIEVPNLRKDFIISSALVHTAKLEASIKGSRLLIAVKKSESDNMTLNWNHNIRYGLYKDDGVQFLDNYEYKDVLWFSSFDDSSTGRAELIELIKVSSKLVKANAHNEKILLQHIWTLRIGLLAYSKYLGRESDPILDMIIKDYKTDKYWLIWMTMFEMFDNSDNVWKYAGVHKVVNFYKTISVKAGWAKLIENLNKPGDQYSKRCLEKFIAELNITTLD